MAQTYTQLFYHLVWSTKNREPLILPGWRPDLHAYIGGIVRNRRGELIAAGGVPDHIHLLARLPADRAVAEVVRDIKAVSSGWRHEHGEPGFAWQGGYGAFTVSKPGPEAPASGYRRHAPSGRKAGLGWTGPTTTRRRSRRSCGTGGSGSSRWTRPGGRSWATPT